MGNINIGGDKCDFNFGQGLCSLNLSFERSPIPMALVALDGTFIKINDAMVDFLEYSFSELCGKKKFQDITHPEDLIPDVELTLKLQKNEIPGDEYSIIKRYITKTGKIVWSKLHVIMMRDIKKNPFIFMSFILPIDVSHKIEVPVLEKSIIKEFLKSNWKFLLPIVLPLILTFLGWMLSTWISFKDMQRILQNVIEQQKAYIEQIEHKKADLPAKVDPPN